MLGNKRKGSKFCDKKNKSEGIYFHFMLQSKVNTKKIQIHVLAQTAPQVNNFKLKIKGRDSIQNSVEMALTQFI